MNTKQLSVKQFAKSASVSPRTVMSWLYANKVPGAGKLGGLWRIPSTALEAMKTNPYAEGSK